MTELNPPTTWANRGIAGLPVIAVAKGRVEPLLLPERPLGKAGAAAGGPPPGQRPVARVPTPKPARWIAHLIAEPGSHARAQMEG